MSFPYTLAFDDVEVANDRVRLENGWIVVASWGVILVLLLALWRNLEP